MSKRKRQDRSRSPLAREPAERFHSILLGAATALLVVAPLVPSEGAAQTGGTVVLSTLWLLLLLGFFLWAVTRKKFAIRLGGVDAALLALVAVTAVSALVAGPQGNARFAFNILWQWVALGASFFLVRQLVRSGAQQRALWLVMIALAVSLAGHGLLQYGYSFPKRRADYQRASEADRRQMLRQANVDPTRGSPARRHFEDRLRGVEPTATFALTNSLAGLLAPWLVAALGLIVVALGSQKHRTRAVTVLGLASLAAAFCLLLTKSRTGYLAAALGVLLLWVYDWRTDRRIPARVSLTLLLVLVVLLLGGVAVGGIDAQLLTQARLSLTYRLEYWQATLAMIGEHPLLGCGPGNFQEAYTAHKLPQASEEIADPHNFVLEIWATAGTAALLALAAAAFLLIRRLRAAWRRSVDPPAAEPTGDPRRTIYYGASAGLLVAAPIGFLVGLPTEMIDLLPGVPLPSIWLIALPVGLVLAIGLDGWVRRGNLPPAMPLMVLSVLLANLLVAGGIGFVGVAQSVWLSAALLLNMTDRPQGAVVMSRRGAVGLLFMASALIAACLATAYVPVLRCSALLAKGDRFVADGDFEAADTAYAAAAAADVRSARAWQRRTELALARWRSHPDQRRFDPHTLEQLGRSLDNRVEQLLQRSRRSSSLYRQIGQWRLELYRAGRNADHLQQAIDAFGQSVRLYPHSNLARAHLAWAYHLAGDVQAASREAREAARLDDANPHHELKLQQQRIVDPGPAANQQPKSPQERSAAQLMEEILGNREKADDSP